MLSGVCYEIQQLYIICLCPNINEIFIVNSIVFLCLLKNVTKRWKASLTAVCFAVYSHSRSYSLDVEVSASGFTKDLERDGALLHPAGPGGGEDDEEEGDEEEATDDEVEKQEQSLDMEEYNHAMLELEGLKVRDTHVDTEDEDNEGEKAEEEKETGIAPTSRSDEEIERDKEEELNEAEDECPELADLSASNKEFKPFR